MKLKSVLLECLMMYIFISSASGSSCEQTFYSGLQGRIHSPLNIVMNSTSSYTKCEYFIQVPNDKRIILQWDSFNVKGYMPTCDPNTEDSVGIYLGDGTLYSKSGVIHTPQWPHPYPSQLDECIWTIIANSAYVIQLNVMHFDVYSDGNSCSSSGSDNLMVEGMRSQHTDSDYHRYFCGFKSPFALQTKHFDLHVAFHQNHYGTRLNTGFVIGYVTYKPDDEYTKLPGKALAVAGLAISQIAVFGICFYVVYRVYRKKCLVRNTDTNSEEQQQQQHQQRIVKFTRNKQHSYDHFQASETLSFHPPFYTTEEFNSSQPGTSTGEPVSLGGPVFPGYDPPPYDTIVGLPPVSSSESTPRDKTIDSNPRRPSTS